MNARIHNQLGDPETQTRIAQYEMSFRMQMSVPEATDISNKIFVLVYYDDVMV